MNWIIKAKVTIVICSIVLLSPIVSEVIDINGLHIKGNDVINIHNYYWKTNKTALKDNDQFRYSLSMTNHYSSQEGMLHLFLISPSQFNYINILHEPGFCCINESIHLCTIDNNNINNSQAILDQSFYYKSYSISPNEVNIPIEDKLSNSCNGSYATYLAYCLKNNASNTQSTSITIKGSMSYLTTSGYLSSELHSIIYLYISLVIYCCIISISWVLLSIKNKEIQKIPCFRVFSITVIVIISNKIIDLIILLFINNKGYLVVTMLYLNTILHVIGNLCLKVIIYTVSLGYTLNLHLRLYKEEDKALPLIMLKKNKFLKFVLLMIFYSFGLFGFKTALVYYYHFRISVIYPVMGLWLMIMSNLALIIQAYNMIKKRIFLVNSTLFKFHLSQYNNALITCFVFNILYVLSLFIYALLSKYQLIMKLKWFGILLLEADQLILFTTLAFQFIITPNQKSQNTSIELELGETKDYSDYPEEKKEV